MNTRNPLTFLIMAHLASLPVPAEHSTPPAAQVVSYDAAFYAGFAPRTALDMVKQTPGFVLADTDEESRRGFAGAVGNVLIDGERLSAKTQSLSDVLQRVPASEVVRIEVLRGTASGDASGSSVLANVVRTPSSGGGAWAVGSEIASRDPAPNGWFGWGGRRGVTEYSLGGNSYSLERELPGQRSVRDAAGTLTELLYDESPREFAEYALNGQAARPLGQGRIALTGQVYYSRYSDQSTVLTTTPAGQTLEREAIPYSESDRIAEAGMSYHRAVRNWELELNALLTRKRFRSDVSASHFDAQGLLDSLFTSALEEDSGESILRGRLTRAIDSGRIEAGAELAVNTLAGASRLTLDTGDGPFLLPIPNDDVTVEENRAEIFFGRTWDLSPWSIEAMLAAEASELRFTGDTRQSVSLAYLKPRLQFTRAWNTHQLQLRLFRDVGQLDFTDFVSSVELSDDIIDGGNPDLRPQTAWAAELIGDFRVSDFALRARVFRHWLDAVNDFVPVMASEPRIDAPGNIGRGTLLGLELTVRVPLGRVWKGASFNASATLQDSEVVDPLTNTRRDISEVVERQVKAELRQDLNDANFAWGIGFTGESSKPLFRSREVDRTTPSSSLDLFLETGALHPVKIRLAMVSALNDAETRVRKYYVEDRSGTFDGQEVSARTPGHWWQLSVSGAF
jgi:hypothetical protein